MSTISDVLLALKGEPKSRSAINWRYGSKQGLCIDVRTGRWVDWSTGERGSLIDLVMRERRCDKAAAQTWLDNSEYVAADPAKIEALLRHDKERRETKRAKMRQVASEFLAAGAAIYRKHPELTKFQGYLERKGLSDIDPESYGLTVIGKSDFKHWTSNQLNLRDGHILLVPMRDIDGTLHCLQGIDAAGIKAYLSGGRAAGCFHLLGDDGELSTIVIVEGLATGISVHLAIGLPVAVCFSASNMRVVAMSFAERGSRVILGGDDDWAKPAQDKKNVGRITAENIARELRQRWPDARHILVFPIFDGIERLPGHKDFNDMACVCGKEAVRAVFDLALTLKPPKPSPPDDPEYGLSGATLADLWAYMPMHSYIFAPCREHWPASSVNSRIPPIPLVDGQGIPVLDEKGKQKTIAPAAWLDRHKPVEQMTWAPGSPMLIRNRLIAEGGWFPRDDVTCFNLYRLPKINPGDATKAGPWLDHCHNLYPAEADHLINWLACRVQRPQDKINHALVLGGNQGIGKDSLLEPVKYAVGPWNFIEVSPQQVLGRFNAFLRSVILRISEARDLGEFNRFHFYDHLKSLTAAPPDTVRIDEKHLREYSILNCTGVIITTNHKTDGIYLPADDRRHFVAWSPHKKEDFDDGYWRKLWGFYNNGGLCHVAAFLAALDITAFNPKAPPPKTQAFWDIVDTGRPAEEAELADVLDAMGNPSVTTLKKIIGNARNINAAEDFIKWLEDRRNHRAVPHRLETIGYTPVRNPDAKDGHWKIDGRRQMVYGRVGLSTGERIDAARKLRGPGQ
jgi:hypothetical protein